MRIFLATLQSVHELDGSPLQDTTHGLKDNVLEHVFRFHADKVVRFDIQNRS